MCSTPMSESSPTIGSPKSLPTIRSPKSPKWINARQSPKARQSPTPLDFDVNYVEQIAEFLKEEMKKIMT